MSFGTVHKREDHLFATHLTEYCIEEIEQSEDHDAFITEVYGGIEVVAYCTVAAAAGQCLDILTAPGMNHFTFSWALPGVSIRVP